MAEASWSRAKKKCVSYEKLPGVTDIFVPPAPGSLMRCALLDQAGVFRLARRTCELYSVEIMNPGAWPRYIIRESGGRIAWYEPSAFTGSFTHGGGMSDLVVEIHAASTPLACINWRETDREVF